jgi:8-oxo-dGTP pyrophosphatase MutT (NUDIX family)
MQQPLTDIAGIECWRIDAARGDLLVAITRDRPPPPTAAVEAEWARRVAANPMLHDGGVLSVLGFDAEANAIAARRDTYKRLAVQPRVPTGVRLLAVTAMLRAVDASGASHVLLGRRSHRTRIYGGCWELGPSGGVGMPQPAVERMGLAELCEHLVEEVREEAGLRVKGPGVPVAYVRDHVAFSDDLVIVLEAGPLEEVRASAGPANWEYEATCWMPVADAARFDGPETIGATRAIFRTMGWVASGPAT